MVRTLLSVIPLSPVLPWLTRRPRSIKAAAEGYDENITNKDDPDVRQLYDRNSPQYPYRSHGQYLRAWYGLIGCILFILFNGWRTFVPPMNGEDFVACYICVCLSSSAGRGTFLLAGRLLTCYRKIPIVLFIYVLYQIKFWGWNPMNWRRRASRELQTPRPEIATSVPRRGVPQIDADDLLKPSNIKEFGRWVWVWLK